MSKLVIHEETPIAIGAKRLSTMLGVSLRHIRRMDAAGKLPRPVAIGRTKRWLVAEIGEWLGAGAPDRAAWEQSKNQIRARAKITWSISPVWS